MYGNAKKLICEVCEVRPTVNQSSEPSRDRKGISSYTFASFCEQCWEEDEDDDDDDDLPTIEDLLYC